MADSVEKVPLLFSLTEVRQSASHQLQSRGLWQPAEYTPDLIFPVQPTSSQKVMQVMDQIISKRGRGTLRPGRVLVAPERNGA